MVGGADMACQSAMVTASFLPPSPCHPSQSGPVFDNHSLFLHFAGVYCCYCYCLLSSHIRVRTEYLQDGQRLLLPCIANKPAQVLTDGRSCCLREGKASNQFKRRRATRTRSIRERGLKDERKSLRRTGCCSTWGKTHGAWPVSFDDPESLSEHMFI